MELLSIRIEISRIYARIGGMKMATTTHSDFAGMIERGTLYIDKTEYVLKMAEDEDQNFYFISRPRRYGKSLMCSTLKYLFEGRRNLFKGLYIDSTNYSFEKYPVLSFNFADLNLDSYEDFIKDFQGRVKSEAKINGVEVEKKAPSSMLYDVLENLDKKAVIIIDEFDAPIIHTYEKKEFAEKIRKAFHSFYSVIKNRNDKVRFLFITGVTKLSNMSIFSAMNNLNDISLSPEYAAMFGYTKEEMRKYFDEHIDAYMSKDGCEYRSKEEFIEAIRDYYDGYRFSQYSNDKVFNPVSVGKFFNNGCRFENYWNLTGVPTLAVELAQKHDLLSIVCEEMRIAMEDLTSFDIGILASDDMTDGQVLAVLYYSGYLTIKDGGISSLSLGFPNTEISSSFTRNLVSRYTDSRVKLGIYADDFIDAEKRNDTPSMIGLLRKYYSEFPYTLLDKEKERSYQLIFFSFFVGIGVDIIAEEATIKGRSDVVLKTRDRIYVIELKVDDTPDSAIRQIKEKRYHEKYLDKGREIHLIGIGFSSKDRQIADWKEEIV